MGDRCVRYGGIDSCIMDIEVYFVKVKCYVF